MVILQFISAKVVVIDLKIQSNQVWSRNLISEPHLSRKHHKTKEDDFSFQFVLYDFLKYCGTLEMFVFLQSRMAVFSARHARPSTVRKQARSLLGRWSTTSFPTASPDTQTPRLFASSTTFLPGSRSELCHLLTKSTLPPLCSDPPSRLFKSLPFLQLLLISFRSAAGCSCRRTRCKSLLCLGSRQVWGRDRLFGILREIH